MAARGAFVCFGFDLARAASLLYVATAISSDSYYYYYLINKPFAWKFFLDTNVFKTPTYCYYYILREDLQTLMISIINYLFC